MKTFQQFNEDARGAGVATRDAIGSGLRAVGDFSRALITKKHGPKKGSAQDYGARTGKAIDTGATAVQNALKSSIKTQNRITNSAISNTADFVKGLVTGKK